MGRSAAHNQSRKLSEFEHLQSLKPEYIIYEHYCNTMYTTEEKTAEREITDSVSLKIWLSEALNVVIEAASKWLALLWRAVTSWSALKDNKVSITCNLLPCWINHRQSQLMLLLSSANGDMWLTTANQAANLSISIIPRESEFLPVQQYLEKNLKIIKIKGVFKEFF